MGLICHTLPAGTYNVSRFIDTWDQVSNPLRDASCAPILLRHVYYLYWEHLNVNEASRAHCHVQFLQYVDIYQQTIAQKGEFVYFQKQSKTKQIEKNPCVQNRSLFTVLPIFLWKLP